jgi:hypothetical protein
MLSSNPPRRQTAHTYVAPCMLFALCLYSTKSSSVKLLLKTFKSLHLLRCERNYSAWTGNNGNLLSYGPKLQKHKFPFQLEFEIGTTISPATHIRSTQNVLFILLYPALSCNNISSYERLKGLAGDTNLPIWLECIDSDHWGHRKSCRCFTGPLARLCNTHHNKMSIKAFFPLFSLVTDPLMFLRFAILLP